MSIDTTERRVPVGSGVSLELLFEGFLRRAAEQNGGMPPKLRDWVSLAEAWRIRHALQQCRGNRSATARRLGIGRRTLYSKMEKLGITASFGGDGLDDGSRAPERDLLSS
jgi:transcriptional regulator with AAA-type ATPase domain